MWLSSRASQREQLRDRVEAVCVALAGALLTLRRTRLCQRTWLILEKDVGLVQRPQHVCSWSGRGAVVLLGRQEPPWCLPTPATDAHPAVLQKHCDPQSVQQRRSGAAALEWPLSQTICTACCLAFLTCAYTR